MSQTPPDPGNPFDREDEPPVGDSTAASGDEPNAIPASAAPQPAADDAAWLNEDDFLPPVEEPPPVEDPPPPPSMRRIGPGGFESLGWMCGAFGLQIIGGIIGGVVVVLVVLFASIGGGSMQVLQDGEYFQDAMQRHADLLFTVAQLVTTAGVLLAVHLRLRHSGGRARALALRGMNWRHLLILILTMVPMLALSMQMHFLGQAAWEGIVELVPALEGLERVSSMETVNNLAKNAEPVLLVLAIAVAPAIWEELVFRGIIGRGLVARYGVPVGILITSLLFAAMHMNPPHVFALLPLSVFLHVVYLSSRSFWAPVLVHFLNNGIAVLVLLSASDAVEEASQSVEQSFAPIVFITSLASVAAFIALLWQTRVEFVTEEGLVWNPGYQTVEAPPEGAPLKPAVTSAPGLYWALATLGLFVFLAAFSAYMSSIAEPPPAP